MANVGQHANTSAQQVETTKHHQTRPHWSHQPHHAKCKIIKSQYTNPKQLEKQQKREKNTPKTQPKLNILTKYNMTSSNKNRTSKIPPRRPSQARPNVIPKTQNTTLKMRTKN